MLYPQGPGRHVPGAAPLLAFVSTMFSHLTTLPCLLQFPLHASRLAPKSPACHFPTPFLSPPQSRAVATLLPRQRSWEPRLSFLDRPGQGSVCVAGSCCSASFCLGFCSVPLATASQLRPQESTPKPRSGLASLLPCRLTVRAWLNCGLSNLEFQQPLKGRSPPGPRVPWKPGPALSDLPSSQQSVAKQPWLELPRMGSGLAEPRRKVEAGEGISLERKTCCWEWIPSSILGRE